jgi:hypothetical protein
LKKFFFFLFFVLTFFFSSKYIFADNFSSSEDYIDSQIFVTSILHIDDLPNEHDLYTIEYNENLVEGFWSGDLSWDTYTMVMGERYRRKLNVYDYVKVPPLTKVAVSALVKNESGHEITLHDWYLFVSRGDRVLGDWKRFGSEGTFNLMYFRFFNKNIYREGNFVYKDFPVNVADGELKFLPLYSFNTSQFLEITHFDWTPNISEDGDLIVDFSVGMKNIATFKINNVEFSHGDFHLERDFNSNATHTYEYQVNYGKEYVGGLNLLDSFQIVNPNTRGECSVRGSTNLNDNFAGDSRSLIVHRNDEGMPSNWFRRIVDVDWYSTTSSMCITLIPYKLKGKSLEYFHPLDFQLKFLESEEFLNIGDDLILNMQIKNTGTYIDALEVDIFFDSNFQKGGDSTWLIQDLDSGEVLEHKVVFQIPEREKFLKLENSLFLDGEFFAKKVFTFFPDIEISFVHNEEFVVNGTSFNDEIILEEDFSRGFLCKKYSFLGLEDEICL